MDIFATMIVTHFRGNIKEFVLKHRIKKERQKRIFTVKATSEENGRKKLLQEISKAYKELKTA